MKATPGFFRVVPGDFIQGPSDARFMVDKLNVKKVVLIDFQEPYSVGLADAAEAVLKASNVATVRLSTSDAHDRLLVARDEDAERRRHRLLPDAAAPGRADVRPAAARAGQEGEGVRRRRRELAGAVQARRARTCPTSHPTSAASHVEGAHRRLEEGQPEVGSSSSFGPPTYGAVQVALRAVKAACHADKNVLPNRRAVLRKVKRVVVPNWILGGTFRFSTKSNDPLNAKFYIFQIQANGTYKLVG